MTPIEVTFRRAAQRIVHRISSVFLFCITSACLIASIASGQTLNQHDAGAPQDMPTVTTTPEIKGVVKVTIDMDKGRTFMAPRAMAVNASIADSHLMDAEVPALLRGAGITTLRYPGGP